MVLELLKPQNWENQGLSTPLLQSCPHGKQPCSHHFQPPPAPPPRSLCERMVGRTGLVNKGRMLWLLPFGGPYPLPLPPQRSIKEDSKVAWEGCLGSIPFSGGVAPWSASDLLPKNLKRTSGEEKWVRTDKFFLPRGAVTVYHTGMP